MVQIAVKARPHEVIEDVFFGDDGPYTFKATKAAGMLSALMGTGTPAEKNQAFSAAKLDWLHAGFTKKDWEHLSGRLEDLADPLDTQHLYTMADALLEEINSRPPTSSTAASGTRSGRTAAKPKTSR